MAARKFSFTEGLIVILLLLDLIGGDFDQEHEHE
jgi:hypothetical protein